MGGVEGAEVSDEGENEEEKVESEEDRREAAFVSFGVDVFDWTRADSKPSQLGDTRAGTGPHRVGNGSDYSKKTRRIDGQE